MNLRSVFMWVLGNIYLLSALIEKEIYQGLVGFKREYKTLEYSIHKNYVYLIYPSQLFFTHL